MNRRLLCILASLALTAGSGGIDSARAAEGGEEKEEEAKVLEVGNAAPEFSLQDIDGETVKLSDRLNDGPVLLDFWALWCKPCLKSLPGTDKLLEEYGDRGLSVLTINTDSPRSNSKVKSYVKSKGYSFEVLLDPNNTLQRLYRFYRIPQVFLISKSGEIAYSQLGYTPANEERLAHEVAKLFPAPEAEKAGD